MDDRDQKTAQGKLPEEDKLSQKGMIPSKWLSALDELFAHTFLCDIPFNELALIFFEFLSHEGSHIQEYASLSYVEDNFYLWTPVQGLTYRVKNMILAAVHKGDDYAKDLLLRIYRTFYWNEYRDLKRFKTISYGELKAFEAEDEILEWTMCRILVMARVMGIEERPDCFFAYEDIQRNVEDDRYTLPLSLESDPYDIDDAGIEENYEEAERLWAKYEKQYRSKGRYKELEEFTNRIYRYFGFIPYYDISCGSRYLNRTIVLSMTLTVLKKEFPKRDFTDDEVMMFYEIFAMINRYTSEIEDLQEAVDLSSGRHEGFENESEGCEFKPLTAGESVSGKDVVKTAPPVPDQNTGKAEKQPAPAKTIPEREDEGSPADMLREAERQLEELRARLKSRDQRIKELEHAHMEDLRREKEQAYDKQLREDERQELISLREFVYHLTEEDVEDNSIDTASMEDDLRKKKITIVGGHGNWTRQLAGRFPGWDFIRPGISPGNDKNTVANADWVYFFTDTISHGTYGKFIRIVRQKGIPFGYIHSTNIRSNIVQIWKETVERMQ